MPIRTPHGRSAAYRGLWQWPLRSPARLALSALVVLTVATLVSLAIGALRPAPPDGPLAAPTTWPTAGPPATFGDPPAPVPTRLPPVPELTPSSLPVAAAPAAALDVAQRWTQAWVRPPAGTSTPQWLDRLRPLTTDEYLGVLSTVDPANISATRVTGPARAQTVSPHSVRVRVPTDTVALVVVVVDDGHGGWRVADYDEG